MRAASAAMSPAAASERREEAASRMLFRNGGHMEHLECSYRGMPRREFTALEINLKRVYRLFSADLTAYSNVFLR